MGDISEDFFEQAGREDKLDKLFEAVCVRITQFVRQHSDDIELPQDFYDDPIWEEKQTLRIASLTALKCMMEIALNHPSSGLFEQETQQKYRLIAMESLWLEGLWREPWVSLTDQEFPGEGPSEDNIESFIQSAADEVIASIEICSEAGQIQDGVLTTLEEAGYKLDDQSKMLAILLVVPIFTYRQRSSAGHVDARKIVAARRLMQAHAKYPQHPALEKVIEKFFSI